MQDIIFNRARALRTTSTDPERILWSVLRTLKRFNLHFRRQVPIGNYIVYFACHQSKLIVELDGSQHGEQPAVEYDAKRTAFLNTRGYRVLRFWNSEIRQNLYGVSDAILEAAQKPPTRSAARSDLPARGR